MFQSTNEVWATAAEDIEAGSLLRLEDDEVNETVWARITNPIQPTIQGIALNSAKKNEVVRVAVSGQFKVPAWMENKPKPANPN